ncbi:MAG: NrfD/PsrC family molybdoenzyme membrane anchor subunit [Planctomycetota bacterium]|jgi:molybdopterin-containing oxidoreductase family membrane subunit
MKKSLPKIALGLFIAAGAAAGTAATLDRLFHGLEVTHGTTLAPWGLGLALYLYFIGLSAGSFLLSTLIYVFGFKRFEPVGRLALFQALGCLGMGMALITFDLGRWERSWRVLWNWNVSSVMAWVVMLYMIYTLVVIAEIWILMRRDFEKYSVTHRGPAVWIYKALALFRTPGSEGGMTTGEHKAIVILAILGIPLAIGVHGGTGLILAVVKARPYWHTGVFPIVFLVSAMASGGALLTVLTAFFSDLAPEPKREMVRGLARLTGAILVLDLFILLVEATVALYGDVPDHAGPYRMIMGGHFWWVFWFVQIVGGAVVPLFLIFFKKTGRSLKWLTVACVLIVSGVAGVRLNLIIPPLESSPFGGLPAQQHWTLNPVGYFPSMNEWLSCLGVVFFGMAAFWIVLRWLPPRSGAGETKED